jgi:hypothetical protein
MDYFYMTDGGLKTKVELDMDDEEVNQKRESGELVKCLLVRCFATKAVFAHVVPCKGIDDDAIAVELVVKDVAWLGHVRLYLKADNERSLQALVRATLLRSKVVIEDLEQLGQEMPQPYDSPSNGGIEVGVRNIRKDFRCMRMDLEERLGCKIPIAHPIMAWLLRHVAFIQCIMIKGDDGLTPWTRVKGRPFCLRLTGFAERVFWKLPGKGPQHQPDGNMAPTWGEGLFLGYSSMMNSYLVASKNGVKVTRAVTRRPVQNRYSIEEVEQLKATPWSMMDKPETAVHFEKVENKEDIPIRDTPAVPRRFRINVSDLETHGFTDGCEQCEHVLRYRASRPGVQHSERCRARVLAEIAKTPAGQARLEIHENRVTETLSRYVEHEATGTQTANPHPTISSMLRTSMMALEVHLYKMSPATSLKVPQWTVHYSRTKS